VHNNARYRRGGIDLMKKIAAVILSVLLGVTGPWLLSVQRVSGASSHVKVILNGQSLEFDDSTAYKSGADVMIPLREAAEALNLFTKKARELYN
jgi:hypothetical protein